MERIRKQGRPRRQSAYSTKDTGISHQSRRSDIMSQEHRTSRSSRTSYSRVRTDYSAPPANRNYMTGDGETGGIKVAVRFRPLSNKERSKGDTAVWGVDDSNNVGLYVRGSFNIKYKYDTVFDDSISNKDVHDTVAAPIVETAMSGVNGTVFAYGVTSSGKTHTMMGEPECPGIVPQSVCQVFEVIENTPDKDFLLRLSMMEIYNEILNDLFEPSRTNLKIREHKSKGIYVEGLKEVEVLSAEHALSLIAAGDANRKVSATQYNEGSSRSHTLCRLSIEAHSRDPNDGGSRTLSYLNLIDLAGSESARAALSKGHRLEGSYINKSLLTLGTVIHKLSEGKSKGHVPYRDSKLTRLLQSSLSGSGSKMAIICTVTPSSSQAEETHNTLKFATRAKKIEIKVSKNEIMDQKSLMLRYQLEINELKRQLESVTNRTARPVGTPEPDPAMQEELTKMRERLEEELHARLKREEDKNSLEARIERLTRLILHSTRAQISLRQKQPKMSRSHSYDVSRSRSMMEAANNGELDNPPFLNAIQTLPASINFSISEMMAARDPGSKNKSNPSYIEHIESLHPSIEGRQLDISPVLRSPGSESVAPNASKLKAENQWLKEQLDLMRQVCADREKDIVRRESECKELRRKVTCYEMNPCSSRSNVTEDETQSLEYTLIKADRGILEDALSLAKKDISRLTDELVRTRAELKATKKLIDRHDNTDMKPFKAMLGDGRGEMSPMSPLSRTISASESIGPNEICHSRFSSIGSEQMESMELPAHLTDTPTRTESMDSDPRVVNQLFNVERKVRAVMSKLVSKDREIEGLTCQLRKLREDGETAILQFKEMSKQNEALKTRLQSTEILNQRMQGYLLDGLATVDLETLVDGLTDASDRIQRTILNRRLATFSAHHEPMDSAEPKELGLDYFD